MGNTFLGSGPSLDRILAPSCRSVRLALQSLTTFCFCSGHRGRSSSSDRLIEKSNLPSLNQRKTYSSHFVWGGYEKSPNGKSPTGKSRRRELDLKVYQVYLVPYHINSFVRCIGRLYICFTCERCSMSSRFTRVMATYKNRLGTSYF